MDLEHFCIAGPLEQGWNNRLHRKISEIRQNQSIVKTETNNQTNRMKVRTLKCHLFRAGEKYLVCAKLLASTVFEASLIKLHIIKRCQKI